MRVTDDFDAAQDSEDMDAMRLLLAAAHAKGRDLSARIEASHCGSRRCDTEEDRNRGPDCGVRCACGLSAQLTAECHAEMWSWDYFRDS